MPNPASMAACVFPPALVNHPLLDLISLVNSLAYAFDPHPRTSLASYGLELNLACLAEEKHLPMYVTEG